MKRVFTIICLLVTMLPAKADCWYNSSWSHRIKIRIVAAQVNGVHTDFPVYFDLNDLSATNFFAEVRADGGDIRITQSDGQTELAREIVAINTGGSTGEMHFKVPDLSGGEVFYIYYGNAAATEPAAGSAFGSENVWTNNFLSVYHLEEDPSGGAPQILDSTSAGIDGTSAGGMATGDSVAGQIENALDFDGINDTIGFPTTSVSSLGGTAAATVSAWANSNNANWNNFGGIATSDNVFALYPINGSRQVGFYFNTGGWVGSFITPANIQVWHKYEVTYDGTTNRSYLDGGATTATAADTGNITGAPTFFDTGGSPTWGLFTDLRVDELRVASVVRSDDWITTSYNNQNSPGAFWTVSSEDEEATEWYGCDWKYREVIRVVPAQVNGTQTDFPLYFDLGDLPADFFTEVRTDGGDIRVTECDGITELAREVVFLDNGASTGEIHFKAPSISGGEEYFIYYGNPSGTDYAVTDTFGAQNVWTNNYLAVWHLDEDPAGGASSITDSSSSGYHGTPQNGLSTADLTAGAQVGKAMNFDGNNERIDIPSGLSTNISGNSFSFSAWDRRDNLGTDDWFWGNTTSGPTGQHLHIGYRTNNRFALGFWGNDLNAASASTPAGTWRHWYATYDTAINQQQLFFDGTFFQSRTSTGDLTGTKNYQIGSRSNSAAASYDGLVDELRFASVVRPADWIDTEYNNQSNSSAFWDLTVIDNVLEVISFSPVDNGTAASVTSNLEVLFDQVPVLLNGDVIIRVLRDDGAFETLDTNGTSITINGNGLNMRLPTPLDYNENYYIELGCGATGPVGGVPFPGFDDNGTWNFYSGIMDTDINFFEKTF